MAIHRISTRRMTRAEWLEERRKSVGGSEIGAIMGLNPYSSPVSVWANKLGLVPDDEPSEAMVQGTDLENYVAERFTRLTGKHVRRCNYILRNDEFPHLHADVDRILSAEDAGLECKTASALSCSRFRGGDFPASYYAQCVAYMAITDKPCWYLAVLVLGREFKVFKMVRAGQDTAVSDWCESVTVVDESEFGAIKSAVAEFWRHVEDGTMPEIDGSAATGATLGKMFPDGDAQAVDLNNMLSDVRQLLALRAEKARVETAARELENRIKSRMGDAGEAFCDVAKITWRAQTRTSVDMGKFKKDHPGIDLSGYEKTTRTRVFKIKEEK